MTLITAACNCRNDDSRSEARKSPETEPGAVESPVSKDNGEGRPEEVLERFLTTYDVSLWDLEAAFDFAGEYFLKGLTNAQKEEVRGALLAQRPGDNEAMVKWLRESMKSFSLGKTTITGDQAVVEATIVSPGGAEEKGWFALIRKEGRWNLVSNGSTHISAGQLKQTTLEIYKKIERQFGWSGLIMFLREAIAKQRPPGEVMAELRGQRREK